MKARIVSNKKFRLGEINPLIYGSFVEHMGRVVYSGIYEPDHKAADENGFRKDVLKKIQEMGVTCIRYPGGNFVSNYDWMDGVGPKGNRPRKREIAWKSIETNEFGTDEFMKWIQLTKAEPIFAVNLGTKGIENALTFLEYCNLPTGTYYSSMRETNGHREPYAIKKWCVGNEMDGIWQIGHKTAEDYGKLAAQTAYAMKALDDSIEIVVCGSSSTSMDTYTDWERIVLENAYEHVNYIALHQYYGGQEYGTKEFLAQSLDLEQYIKTIIGICDTVKSKKRLTKEIDISIDEWGVWEISGDEIADSVSARDWGIAPAISEQIYTMEDSLLFASMLMAMLKNSSRVKMACQSLLTNISAAIMTEKNGDCWVQPIYFPFAYMSKYGRGVVLNSITDIPCYESKKFGTVPNIDMVSVYNDERKELVYFLVNRTDETAELIIEPENFVLENKKEHIVLEHKNLKATNQKNHLNIAPKKMDDIFILENAVQIKLPAYSWNMIRLGVE